MSDINKNPPEPADVEGEVLAKSKDSAGTDDPPGGTIRPNSAAAVLEGLIDRVVQGNSMTAASYIERLGGGKDGPALLRRLDRQYVTTLSASGAAVGATAAAPGVGIPVSLALSAGEALASLEATMLYVLAYAHAHGVELKDIERRRTLLLAVLLGGNGIAAVEKVAGTTGKHLGKKLAESVPLQTIKNVNKVLGHNFVTRFGTRQGIIVLGRVAPFGIGMVIGGGMGAANSAIVVRATRRVFGVSGKQKDLSDLQAENSDLTPEN